MSSIPGCWSPRTGVFLDPRRAAFLQEHRLLLISDLHIGFAWTQRRRGQLLPLDAPDDLPGRIIALCRDWNPSGLVVLGDFVHGAAPLEGIRHEIETLLTSLPSDCPLRIVLGNHDVRLPEQLARWNLSIPCVQQHEEGEFHLIHGDQPGQPSRADLFQIQGHEHPAIEIPDPPAGRVRVPAFLLSHDRLILPAFSRWAAGSVIGHRPFLSASTQAMDIDTAVACLGPRLLPVPRATLIEWHHSLP